ncbi:MAG: RNA polymerase-binding protein DksA [Steroidobacteraceae bacterium]
MPAKKPAPKPGKSKKAMGRPVARKAVARKPLERAKAAAHPRAKAPARKTALPTAPAPMNGNAKESDLIRALNTPQPPPAESAAPAPARSVPVAARITPDAEDTDTGEPGSLLAGPRNVKPYTVKRGEQYMSKEQTEHFRQILLSWKRDLMEEVDRTVTHMKDEAANFPDPNDRATQEEEFSLELRTRDRERKLIRKIDEALKRIEDGTYGYCLETGEEIGIKRLEARPVATLSIEAQERRERRERQYGDRDDRYR